MTRKWTFFNNLRDRNNKHRWRKSEKIFSILWQRFVFRGNWKVASLFIAQFSFAAHLLRTLEKIQYVDGLKDLKQTNIDEPHVAWGDEINSTLQSRNFNFPSFPIWSFSRLFFIFFRSRTISPSADVCRAGGWLCCCCFYGCLFSFYQFWGFKKKKENLLWNFLWRNEFSTRLLSILSVQRQTERKRKKSELKYLLDEKCQRKFT